METIDELTYQNDPTFEKLYLSIIKLSEENRIKSEETERKFQESSERLERKLSKWGNRYGEIIEALASPALRRKFKSFGFDFTELSRDKEIVARGQFVGEIDMLLENGDSVMVVEMKSKPSIDDINDHIECMNKLRSYVDGKGDKRKYFGAIGGIIFQENVRDFALKKWFLYC
jgi:hypothetical protein